MMLLALIRMMASNVCEANPIFDMIRIVFLLVAALNPCDNEDTNHSRHSVNMKVKLQEHVVTGPLPVLTQLNITVCCRVPHGAK